MKNTFGLKCAFLYMLSINPVSAMELDENCTVNILNRAVQVEQNGSWSMPNVPSFMGRVRARATCVREGVTTSGQSQFFNVINNGNVLVDKIVFDDPTPVPASLSFANNNDIQLVGAAFSAALEIRATYSGASQSDVLTSLDGINFNSSNSDIASVDENGVVIAVNSGSVLITARLEGVIALKRVNVSISGDMDGDGLPDDYEVANDLDPNDPIDAFEDMDGDGLSNLEEFQAGTDLNNADTDGDGISDWEELNAGVDGFITNPLLADSDGDGINDGLEVGAGTDPTDSNSRDLTNVLDSISVDNQDIILTYNTLNNEVSRQLTVTGTLIDGSSIDLTAKSSGTNYTSSDLTVLSFGLTDGEIFGGAAGVATLTVENSGFSTQAFVTVVNFAPTPVGFIQLPSNARNVDVVDGYAYVAADTTGLIVIDTSNPEHPSEVTRIDTPGSAFDVRVNGDYLYLADRSGGLVIYDISSPRVPLWLATVPLTDAQDVSIANGFAYVSEGAVGTTVLDVRLPNAPVKLDTLTGFNSVGVDTDGGSLVAVSSSDLYVYDIRDPASPVLSGSVAIAGGVEDVAVRDRVAYVAAFREGFRVIDISDPTNLVNTVGDNPFFPNDVALTDTHAFFSEILFPSAMPYVNIQDAANPVYQGFVDFSRFSDYDGYGISVDRNYAYMVARRGSASRLYIAQHSIVEDTLGVAPEVMIEKPTADSVAAAGLANDFVVNASDDIAVASVRFDMNGETVGVRSTKPYRVAFTPPQGAVEVTLSATAFDIAGNVSETVELTIPVEDLEIQPGFVLLKVEPVHPGANLPELTKALRFEDVNTQLKAAVQAKDLAIEGWGLDATDNTQFPPVWSGPLVAFFVDAAKSEDFGYAINTDNRYLIFHTDDLTGRGSHDICEQPNNFGIISGARSDIQTRCVVPEWGHFFIEDVSGIPPEISFANPNPDLVLQGGINYEFNIEASDDVAVESVSMLVDGVVVDQIASAPYVLNYIPPFNVGPIVNVEFVAVDFGGRTATTGNIIYSARADSDQDGLSDDDELAIHGTDPNNPDSDGDSLLDGEEVNTHSTNPLLADTDGDLLPDDLEVSIGTSPTDANDKDFSSFVTALQLSDNRVVESYDGVTPIGFEILASVEISNEGKTWLIDVSDQSLYSTVYTLNKTDIVTHDGNGAFSVVGLGFDKISVSAYGVESLADVVVLDSDSPVYEDTVTTLTSNETVQGLGV